MDGSCWRPALARRQLDVITQMAKIGKLKEVPHHHALLLLREYLQWDLRHLQRTLRMKDLKG